MALWDSGSRDVHCVNGCGFFGNPEWEWYCSKCWRERNNSLSSKPSRALLGKSESFFKFEKKKKRHGVDRNFKQIFRKKEIQNSTKNLSSFSSSSTNTNRSSKPIRHSNKRSELPPEATAVSAEFASFLNNRLDSRGTQDISRQIKGLIDEITKKVDVLSIDDISSIVQTFYRSLQNRLECHQLYQGLSGEERASIMEYSEKYTMICCYKFLFCPTTSDDEEKDLDIQNRIRCLNWISTKDLKCCISETSQEVRDLLYIAINDILEMDGKMAPHDKMECLVRCCKTIFEMLKISRDSPASADEFLPCLIYVCLKANPPRIQSNIHFITKFCNENKLRMGEGGYFFANLCCAMSYIETLDASSINMEKEEFESYVSGKAVPPGSWQSSLLMCEGLQIMSQNLKTLSDLQNRHDRIQNEALKLQKEMNEFQDDIKEEIESVLKRTEYTIKVSKSQALIDLDVPENHQLPSSLEPSASAEDDKESPKLLEDFLNSSSTTDCASLLSLDMNSSSALPENDSLLSFDVSEDDNAPDNEIAEYRGFSAQSFSIPSIPCNNAIKEVEEDEVSQSTTATDSNNSTTSGEEDDAYSELGGGKSVDNQDKLVNVISGISNTPDNTF